MLKQQPLAMSPLPVVFGWGSLTLLLALRPCLPPRPPPPSSHPIRDQWFPEAARALALQGAEVVLFPTAIGSEPQDPALDSYGHWVRVQQVRRGVGLGAA